MIPARPARCERAVCRPTRRGTRRGLARRSSRQADFGFGSLLKKQGYAGAPRGDVGARPAPRARCALARHQGSSRQCMLAGARPPGHGAGVGGQGLYVPEERALALALARTGHTAGSPTGGEGPATREAPLPPWCSKWTVGVSRITAPSPPSIPPPGAGLAGGLLVLLLLLSNRIGAKSIHPAALPLLLLLGAAGTRASSLLVLPGA